MLLDSGLGPGRLGGGLLAVAVLGLSECAGEKEDAGLAWEGGTLASAATAGVREA